MKLVLILLILTLSQAETTSDGNLKPIRKTQRGTLVYRFDDGLNTCYLADTDRYQGQKEHTTFRPGSVDVALSCVTR